MGRHLYYRRVSRKLDAASISNGDFETGDPLGENGFRGGIETWTAVGSNQATLGSGFATSGHTGNIGTFWQGSGIRQDIGETVTANTPIQVQFAIGRRDWKYFESHQKKTRQYKQKEKNKKIKTDRTQR